MSAGEKYAAAAYLVVLAAVLAYVVIIAAKLARIERQIDELTELARGRAGQERPEREVAEVG